MSVSNPIVTVVIPYRNRMPYLRHVLDAYEKQSYPNLEIIVVDDGSNTEPMLASNASGLYVRYYNIPFRHRFMRRGLCRNFGAARAQGDIFIFNDADIIPEYEAVAHFAKACLANNDLILCGRIHRLRGGLEAIDGVNSNKADDLMVISTPWEFYDASSIEWSTIESVRKSERHLSFVSGFCCFNRRTFMSLLGFDPHYFGWGGEDTDIGYRIFKHGYSLAFMRDTLGFHIDHPESKDKGMTALRNLDYFTSKFPELKSSFQQLRQERELMGADSRVLPEDPVSHKRYCLGLRRFLEHPMLYSRRLYRTRSDREGSISVVIPAKNTALYLEEAVRSSIHQTRPPDEIFIVVDPSDDGTGTLARELARELGEVRCIINDRERGVAEARNQGIVAAASDYVMFLDSDDTLNPWYFEKVAVILDQNQNVGVAYSDYIEFGDRNRIVKPADFDPRLLLVDCIIGTGVGLARRRALEDVGGFDADQILEDWELWIRLTGKGWKAEALREPLYNYRIRTGSRDAMSNHKRVEGQDMIYQKHRQLYDRYHIGRTSDGKWVDAPIGTWYFKDISSDKAKGRKVRRVAWLSRASKD